MKIHLLPSEVVDQIAAGEVLDRPANLVKELVENSLDANATEIEVHVSYGGRTIRIVDNGAGIDSEDLSLALDRHATSKINKSSDIWGLQTFGFRGEALASISAVSKLKITSRTEDSKSAYGINSDFGIKTETYPTGGEKGTSVEAAELFANIPARLKFLKSDSAEVSQIKKTLKALALANPIVNFRVYINDELFAHWPSRKVWQDRAEDVLGKNNLLSAQGSSAGLKLTAFFTQPNEVEKTSQQMWFFVNKRWIQDRSLQTAVMEAYRNLLMHGEYPTCAVFIEVSPELVDVNVHPTKSQVKFGDARAVFRIIHQTVRNELEQARWVRHVVTVSENQNTHSSIFANNLTNSEYSKIPFESVQIALDEGSSFQTQNTLEKSFLSVNQSLNVEPKWADLHILGQANLTYIVTQNVRGMLFIDQHAAHERINFEKLMRSWKTGKPLETQTYLIPISLKLEAAEIESILSLREKLYNLGVEVEQGGPDTLLVSSAPAILKEESIVKSLHKLAQDIIENGDSLVFEKKIGDVFATMACHSSVRAGQSLSIEEMKALLEQMDEFTLSSFCPHGRPVFVEYTFKDLDTDFGRIV